jgi:nicotinamide riboside transporter PnuC
MKEKKNMKLSKPKVITWWIAVILGVIGILATLTPIPAISEYAFWFVAAGFVLLALATALKDL